jgi:hypothetical protein
VLLAFEIFDDINTRKNDSVEAAFVMELQKTNADA